MSGPDQSLQGDIVNQQEQVAIVRYGEKHAGFLTKTPSGYTFAYRPEYLQDSAAHPISIRLPLEEKKFTSPSLFPFFENMLPEGWLLELTSTVTKTDPHDTFSLLLKIGANPVGAVSVTPSIEQAPLL